MKNRIAALFFLLVVCAASLFAADPPQAKKLKVYISVDMEGVAGAVTGDQLGPTGFEYARFREFMTREALAAVHAAKEAGATEILVSDSHGNGENLLIELFPPDVRIIRSWPRHLSMMAGIDESFDAVIFIGYHASTNNSAGVRAHTFSSARLTRVALNGTNVTEGAWNGRASGQAHKPVQQSLRLNRIAVAADEHHDVGRFQHVFRAKANRMRIRALEARQVREQLGLRVVFEADVHGHRHLHFVRPEISQPGKCRFYFLSD